MGESLSKRRMHATAEGQAIGDNRRMTQITPRTRSAATEPTR